MNSRLNEFNAVEIVEENTLDFSEPYKDWKPSAVKGTYAEWTSKLGYKADEALCTKDDEDVNFDYEQRVVKFWRSETRKSNRELRGSLGVNRKKIDFFSLICYKTLCKHPYKISTLDSKYFRRYSQECTDFSTFGGIGQNFKTCFLKIIFSQVVYTIA